MKLSNILKRLPKTPGVYYFFDKKERLLYIGKATSLKNRVASYFQKISDAKIQSLASQIANIKIRKTDSVLEALVIEANEIKKRQPPYNIRSKDDKSFVNIIITKEDFPRVLVVRPTEKINTKIKKSYGPYVSAKSARIALKIIRKIFPFHSLAEKSEKNCFYFHLGLCPGPYGGRIDKENYAKIIRHIEAVLEGKKTTLIKGLEKEMKKLSKENKFEEAAVLRDKIFALRHIQDVALLTDEYPLSPLDFNGRAKLKKEPSIFPPWQDENNKPWEEKKITIPHRIEAYDISNISGQYAVGSMAVFLDGEIAKDEYRKFKIKTVKNTNDVGMLREVLKRRFRNDWPLPDLILMDGGRGQVNIAQKVLNKYKLNIPVIGAAKGPTRKKLDLYFSDENIIRDLAENIIEIGSRPYIINRKLISHIMAEAHRFAISYHRLLRSKGALNRRAG